MAFGIKRTRNAIVNIVKQNFKDQVNEKKKDLEKVINLLKTLYGMVNEIDVIDFSE